MIELIGIILPPIVDIIVAGLKVVDDKKKILVTFLVCLVVQCGLTYFDNQFVFATLKEASEAVAVGTMALMGLATASYQLVWRDSSVREDMDLKTK